MTQARQPRQIGRYQIVDVLGAGAMGVVYRAHDPAIGRDVAIKLLRIDASSTPEHAAAVERLRIEARAAGRCQHPGIVSVFDFVEQDGTPAIVMEFVEGRSLHGHLRDRAARAALDPLTLIRQVLLAVAYAHGQGVIHRDIKPANILITAAGAPKIADFGIARLPDLHATMTGAALGTPNYMAPEQLRGGTIDQRADLFSVGAILYELLAGRPPFAGQTSAEALARLAGPDPADLEPIHPAYRPVLARAVAKEPAERFLTAEEFAAALASGEIGPTPTPADAETVLMPSGGSLPAWEPEQLQTLERSLAQYLGPMARLLVARAAQEAATGDALVTALAAHLPDETDRSAFLRAATAGRSRAGGSGGSRPGVLGSGVLGSGGLRSGGPRSAGRGSGGLGSGGLGSGGLGSVSGALGSGGRGLGSTGGRAGLASQRVPGGAAARPFAGVPDDAAAAAQALLVQHVGPIARVLVRQAAREATSARDFTDRLCAQVPAAEQAALRKRLMAEVEPRIG